MDNNIIAQRRDNSRLIPLPQPTQRGHIEMIVMIVRNKHDVDLWKL